MPEYLAPGVYVEEVSYRSKSIEGVSTTTTGFIGPARYGPLDMEPELVTSTVEFERMYGDRQQLNFNGQKLHNYLWHAVRAFFAEGGKRLYVARVFRKNGSSTGRAQGKKNGIAVSARFPGKAGEVLVRFALNLSKNVLSGERVKNAAGDEEIKPRLNGVNDYDVVWIKDVTAPVTSPPGSGTFYIAQSKYDTTARETTWKFVEKSVSPPLEQALSLLKADIAKPAEGDQVCIATVTVTVTLQDGSTLVWDNLPPDPNHTRDGQPDSLFARFAEKPENIAQGRTIPIVLTPSGDIKDGTDVLQALFGIAPAAPAPNPKGLAEIMLADGDDGLRPGADEYEGAADQDSTTKTGLKAFEDVEDISIVAAPGSTYLLEDGYRKDALSIMNLLIAHATRMRYRIAVLDSGEGQSISQVRQLRAKIDSSYAALYYPWVRVLDPVTRQEIVLPPSGFVAGIYARNDVNRAVYKAPANEVVNLALGFEQLLNKSQQDVLNPEGVNCFRYFEGRGYRLWGARTVSSDPEWKYVNLRRYFAYLERSIDKGTQWAVFEPNGDALWANMRRTVEDFLLNEWQSGALLGEKPEKAFFVRCDRSTMTQNDLDNGRLIVLIGVAALRPAEFVIFRIGQWTADRKS